MIGYGVRRWGAVGVALLLALIGVGWLGSGTAQAGTVTIEDGPASTLPANGVFTDGYIESYLAITGSLTITTTGVVSGADDIRVQDGVVISWTTGNTLTLDAGRNIIIRGVIQQDGPASGAGGVTLLANDTANGAVLLGPGDQLAGVAVGSRFGLTRVAAGSLTLSAATSAGIYAQLGFVAVDQGAGYTVTGPISVTAGVLTVYGGPANLAYAQIGHGGADLVLDGTPSGDFSGAIAVEVSGDVTFQAGGATNAYAQLGNGGSGARGNHGGNHRLSAGGNVTFQAGGDELAYAHLGNGGVFASGDHHGSHTLRAGGDVSFLGGGKQAYAQMGNGGDNVDGNHSGSQTLEAGGDVTFQAGEGAVAVAQMGNGGDGADGTMSGDVSLGAGGDVRILGAGVDAYAQIGNGAALADGTQSGDLAVTITGSLTMTGQGDAYAMIGHGSDTRATPGFQGTGERSGDITVRVGASAVFSGSQVGHLSADGVDAVTAGRTLIGVSQNDPFSSGTGQLVATGVQPASFRSALAANEGELRVYLPRADSQQIPTSATFNGGSFATANTIPPAHLAGNAPFGDGPYIAEYSFYLGGQPDMGVGKTAQQPGPLAPGDALTYTISFANTGTVTATGVVISDSLPSAVAFVSATVLVDGGVVVTQTGSAPNLAWQVSGLGPLKDGQIVVGTTVQNAAPLGTPFSNTAVITASGDITFSNNSATVVRSVVAAASVIITKTVVGTAPANTWNFSGSGAIGRFDLPAGGGSQGYGNLLPGTYTITETVKPGYTAVASCTTGQSGTNSVQVTLAAGVTAGCTFTNTFVPTPEITQTLTVNKVVVGGPLAADNFPLFIDGSPVSRGVANSLSAGQHTVSETSVSTYTAAFGGACNNSGKVNLAAGSHVTCTITNTFVQTPTQTGAIEGLVYVDENSNEQPDSGEGLQGVTVTLQSKTGVAAALTLADVTDSDGEYRFTGVPVGDYTLSFDPPAGYQAIDAAEVTVTAGQTVTAPTRAAVPEGTSGGGKVYVPVIQR